MNKRLLSIIRLAEDGAVTSLAYVVKTEELLKVKKYLEQNNKQMTNAYRNITNELALRK